VPGEWVVLEVEDEVEVGVELEAGQQVDVKPDE
jgi:hypothetical protein